MDSFVMFLVEKVAKHRYVTAYVIEDFDKLLYNIY